LSDISRLVIAAASSGAGKTSFTLGLLGALRARGLEVAAFKAGPDYIDTQLHAAVLRRPSRNLDIRLMGRGAVLACLARNGADNALSVIEGVMGLYDGSSLGTSTADLAVLTASPVLLLVDASASAESAGAVALGFASYRRDVRVAAVILNRIAGKEHFEAAKAAVYAATGLPVLGYLPSDPALSLPERHLGLVEPGDSPDFDRAASALAAAVEAHVDLDALIALAESAPCLPAAASSAGYTGGAVSACAVAGADAAAPVPALRPLRVAVARDAAFSFYYEDNFDAMRDAGLEPVFFSPLEDPALPTGVSGLYLGGGYPELHAAALGRNDAMRDSIRRAAAAGLPVFSECGGYLYLLESLEDLEGRAHAGCGILPGRARMGRKLAALGYREGRTLRDSVLGPAGTLLSGHVFHFSTVEGAEGVLSLGLPAPAGAGRPARPPEPDGSARGSAFGSYLHLHFAKNPEALANFAAACRTFAR
jgi:cobyrinic acid a,c-diamide synthase